MNLQLVTEGPRLYVMGSGDKDKMFSLKNREFIFTVDDSTLTCGLNGALYFVETDQRGGVGMATTITQVPSLGPGIVRRSALTTSSS